MLIGPHLEQICVSLIIIIIIIMIITLSKKRKRRGMTDEIGSKEYR